VLTHLVFRSADGEAGGAVFHKEATDALTLGGGFVGDGPDHEHTRVFGTGDEDLVAVQNPFITVQHRGTTHPRRVRTRRGFCEAEAAGVVFAGANLGNVGLLLFFRADGLDDFADHVVHRTGHGRGGTGPGDFRDGEAEGHGARFGTAVFGLDGDAHQAQFGQLLKVFQECLAIPLFIEFGGHRFQFRFGKIPRRILNHLLVFR